MTFDATLVLIDFSPEQPDDSKARKWMSEDSRSSNQVQYLPISLFLGHFFGVISWIPLFCTHFSPIFSRLFHLCRPGCCYSAGGGAARPKRHVGGLGGILEDGLPGRT